MSKSIEIVTHCWAEKYPLFAGALHYQLSSIYLYARNLEVRVSICAAEGDWTTINEFRNRAWRNIDLMVWPMSLQELGRRSIGRNMAAKKTEADIVWFCDADHFFRTGCLQALSEMDWPEGASMIFPKDLMIHKDHKTGDAALEFAMLNPGTSSVNPEDFVPKHYNRAIGGVQIVQGDFAREHGYLDKDEKWQKPRTDGKPFGDFKDDIAYRKKCLESGPIVGVDLPGLCRLRHTETTYQPPVI